MCNPNSPERQTDISNCGTCFHSCLVPNSDPVVRRPACASSPASPASSTPTRIPTNGCECVKTNGGVEACDGLDNNCNGAVDDGFDFMTDVANCGGCNVTCSFPFATASCVNGVCTQGACLPGFYDRDPNVAGLRDRLHEDRTAASRSATASTTTATASSTTARWPATIACQIDGRLRGHAADLHRDRPAGSARYPATYQDVEDTTKACDSSTTTATADRRGVPDRQGLHRRLGRLRRAERRCWVCDNSMRRRPPLQGSPKPPGTEVCNGLDDDCDGKVDELDSASNRTSDDKLVYLAGQNVTMFAYEASRYDANATNYGFDSTRRPCSVRGRQPWSNVTKEEAEAACEKIGTGWRLCTAAEWLDACNGIGQHDLPVRRHATAASSCNG